MDNHEGPTAYYLKKKKKQKESNKEMRLDSKALSVTPHPPDEGLGRGWSA